MYAGSAEYLHNDFNQIETADAPLFGDSNYWYAYYDDNGNLSSAEAEDYSTKVGLSHNRENRLGSFWKEGPSVSTGCSYIYDFSGRLLMRTDNDGNKRKYYYDGINTLLTREKPYGSGTCFRTASAFVLKNASIGQIITEKRYSYATDSCSQTPTTDYVAYHYDHIGNVVALTDCDGLGTFRTAYDMDAFGNVAQGDQDGIHLTGKAYDPGSGLYYFGARWYDPHTGKFLQVAPFPIDIESPYTFVNNNPIYYVEPRGEFWDLWPFNNDHDEEVDRYIDKVKNALKNRSGGYCLRNACCGAGSNSIIGSRNVFCLALLQCLQVPPDISSDAVKGCEAIIAKKGVGADERPKICDPK